MRPTPIAHRDRFRDAPGERLIERSECVLNQIRMIGDEILGEKERIVGVVVVGIKSGVLLTKEPTAFDVLGVWLDATSMLLRAFATAFVPLITR